MREPSTVAARWAPHDADPAEVARVEGEVAALAGMDLGALRICWRKAFRKPAPEHLRPWLLRKVLAYRIRAKAWGDLDAATLEALRGALATKAKDERRSDARQPPPPRPRGHAPGTIFLREHGGEMHRVTQLTDGFEYQGERHASLSQIAKRITGTSWNGPRFFGLRDGDRKPSAEHGEHPSRARR